MEKEEKEWDIIQARVDESSFSFLVPRDVNELCRVYTWWSCPEKLEYVSSGHGYTETFTSLVKISSFNLFFGNGFSNCKRDMWWTKWSQIIVHSLFPGMNEIMASMHLCAWSMVHGWTWMPKLSVRHVQRLILTYFSEQRLLDILGAIVHTTYDYRAVDHHHC